MENTSSGGFCSNDAIIHMTLPSLPFGGVGGCDGRVQTLPKCSPLESSRDNPELSVSLTPAALLPRYERVGQLPRALGLRGVQPPARLHAARLGSGEAQRAALPPLQQREAQVAALDHVSSQLLDHVTAGRRPPPPEGIGTGGVKQNLNFCPEARFKADGTVWHRDVKPKTSKNKK